MRVKDVNSGGFEEFYQILFPSALKDVLKAAASVTSGGSEATGYRFRLSLITQAGI